MSNTGLEVFDTTLQQTNAWLKAIMERLDTGDRHLAYLCLRTTLHALRDRMDPDRASHLAAQLPMLVRGFYYEGWHPAATPTRDRTVETFLQPLAAVLKGDPNCTPEDGAAAVFATIADHVAEGEVSKVIRVLPQELRHLWPTEAVNRAVE